MRDTIFAMRGRLALASGIGLSLGLTSACLDTAPEDTCFDRAAEVSGDEVIQFSIYLSSTDEGCPGENSAEVKEEAKSLEDCNDAKLKYVACGPRQNGTACDYVAVYSNSVSSCDIIGRPFLVDARERTASLRARADWAACASAVERPERPELRAALAEHWREVALAEHASIAAFARFAAQLLRVGAPPSLLRACHRAARDEARHARLAFGLASRFAGEAVGPGELELRGAFAEIDDVDAIVRDVVLEGCLGETRAAMDARIAASRCADPELAAVLETIAEDEERHAALAWRFVAWVVAARPALAPSVRAALAMAMDQTYAPREVYGSGEGRRWGLLDAATRRTIDTEVRAQIVAVLGAAAVDERQTQTAARLG